MMHVENLLLKEAGNGPMMERQARIARMRSNVMHNIGIKDNHLARLQIDHDAVLGQARFRVQQLARQASK